MRRRRQRLIREAFLHIDPVMGYAFARVPAPATAVLLAMGLVLTAMLRRRA